MSDPQDAPEDKLFSGSIHISVYVKIDDINGESTDAVAQEAVKGLRDDLRNMPQYDMIELETHDLWQTNRKPDFWDKVDQAHDHAKHHRT
jgi:hypothetical protein